MVGLQIHPNGARKIETQKINIKKLNSILPDIRQMPELKFKDACKSLQQCLAECGVATIFLPYVEGSFLHGATFRLGNKIVMGIAVREKENEKFLFSLFHEVAHIVLGHMNQKEGTSDEEELQADSFAKNAYRTQVIDLGFSIIIQNNKTKTNHKQH